MTASVSVVIPTLTGREGLLERTLQSYRDTAHGLDLELITVPNCPTIGEAWNAGAGRATGDWLALSADDVLVHAGWWDTCIETVESYQYPCPVLYRIDGSLESGGTMGGGMLLPQVPADWTPCGSSPFPFWRTGEYPGCLPIHYYADDYLAHRARLIGFMPAVRTGYRLTHLEGTVGRARVAASAMQDRARFLSAISEGATACVS